MNYCVPVSNETAATVDFRVRGYRQACLGTNQKYVL